MIKLFELAQELQTFCENNRWNYCFIGGLALQRWGEPRLTQDIDLTLVNGFGNEEPFIQALLKIYSARIPDAEEFALQSRVLLLHSKNGIGIDIALGGLSFESLAVKRSSFFEFTPGNSIRTCSAEDLVVLKAFADRAKDWVDISGILVRQSKGLDWDYILTQLKPLVEIKESPQILDRLRKLRSEI
jgi:hypothetical protein